MALVCVPCLGCASVRDVSTRRDLLAHGLRLGALGTCPLLGGAAGPSDLRIAQLKIGPDWNPRPTAVRRLLWEVAQRTSIEVSLEQNHLAPQDDGLFHFPLLYWAGVEATPPLADEAASRLRRHLTYGGMLWVDSAEGRPGYDRSVRQALGRLFPRQELERIPPDHVIYKSFYLVGDQPGRVLRKPYLEGLKIQERYAVIYSHNDLGGAWARDAFGRWEHEVTPGGERQRELTFRLGVNLAMYAMCLDYKDDLVHTPFILKRRR